MFVCWAFADGTRAPPTLPPTAAPCKSGNRANCEGMSSAAHNSSVVAQRKRFLANIFTVVQFDCLFVGFNVHLVKKT